MNTGDNPRRSNMSTTDAGSEPSTGTPGVEPGEARLEVMALPVSDVDRAKRFYEKLGFRLDIDYVANEDFRVIQFTPPGSEASIIFGKGITSVQPGSIDRPVLAVYDIDAARDDLIARGIDVSE